MQETEVKTYNININLMLKVLAFVIDISSKKDYTFLNKLLLLITDLITFIMELDAKTSQILKTIF